MFSDGYAHSLEWFSDTYKEIQVGREDFPAEKEKGLYWFTGDLRIPEGTEQIVFTYRNPEGALIQRENVFVVRDGEQGDPAPQYLGMFANPPAAREDNTPLQKGDTYLNKTDRKLYRYDGLDWIAVPDEDPGWWEALGDAVKEAAESGVQITAANAWVEKLVAGTVLAQRLFTQQLVLSENGQIKSANYQAGQSGFQIRADGTAEFNNSIFRGMLYAQGGRFENAEILNCSGSMKFAVESGSNYLLKRSNTINSTSPTTSSISVAATGSVKIKINWTCYTGGTTLYAYIKRNSQIIVTIICGGSISINGIPQSGYSGSFEIDSAVTEGDVFTSQTDKGNIDRYDNVIQFYFSLYTKYNPGILKYI